MESGCLHFVDIKLFAEKHKEKWSFSHNCPYFENLYRVGEEIILLRSINTAEDDYIKITTGGGKIHEIVNKKWYVVEIDENIEYSWAYTIGNEHGKFEHYPLKNTTLGKKYVVAKYHYLRKEPPK